ANVRARAAQLRRRLEGAMAARPGVVDVRVVGLMAAVELGHGDHPARTARRVAAAMVQRGVLVRSMGADLMVVPPLTVTADEVDRIVAAMEEAYEEVVGR